MIQSHKVNFKLISLLLILGLSSLAAIAQELDLITINLEDIQQRKVRKYIVSRKIDHLQDFSSIHPSWNKEINISEFKVNKKIYYLKSKLSSVWESYRNIKPIESWNRNSIRLGLLITKCTNSVVYARSSDFPEIDTGQVYFLNLRLLKGVFNVPVAFEIINIDPGLQIIELSYIENNVSRGKQTLQFFDNGDGSTKIVHLSYFKSESWLRDDLFYPFFHKRFINEFHRNIRKLNKHDSQLLVVD